MGRNEPRKDEKAKKKGKKKGKGNQVLVRLHFIIIDLPLGLSR